MKHKFIAITFAALLCGLHSLNAHADVAYLSLDPEIVTNYAGENSSKLGYVRVSIELMLFDTGQLEVAEHHLPLLRATVIEIFGSQTKDKVKSLTGREDIRLTIKKALQDSMMKETGSEIVKDVIFTKYLQQG